MIKANNARYPVNWKVAALQERHTKYSFKQEACPEYRIPVPAYLALALPGHPPPLGPSGQLGCLHHTPIRQGNLQLAQNNWNQGG